MSDHTLGIFLIALAIIGAVVVAFVSYPTASHDDKLRAANRRLS